MTDKIIDCEEIRGKQSGRIHLHGTLYFVAKPEVNGSGIYPVKQRKLFQPRAIKLLHVHNCYKSSDSSGVSFVALLVRGLKKSRISQVPE
jgi:hypothetical protein